jgi:hypothetical protein
MTLFLEPASAVVHTASEVGRKIMENEGLDGIELDPIVDAILAERERCAAYHDDMAAQHEPFRHDAKGELIEHHTKMVRFHLASAAAIRSPQPSSTAGASHP